MSGKWRVIAVTIHRPETIQPTASCCMPQTGILSTKLDIMFVNLF